MRLGFLIIFLLGLNFTSYSESLSTSSELVCGGTTVTYSNLDATSATITWTAASNATSYNLIHFDGSNWVLAGQFSPKEPTTFDLQGLTPGTEYKVCVDVYCDFELNNDNCVTFITPSTPNTCEVSIDNVIVTDVDMYFSWSSNASNYYLELVEEGNVVGSNYVTYTELSNPRYFFNLDWLTIFDEICITALCDDGTSATACAPVLPPDCSVETAVFEGKENPFISLDVANVETDIISSHIIGANRNHTKDQLDDLPQGNTLLNTYAGVSPAFGEGEQRKLYRIGHLPFDGTTGSQWGYPGFFFIDPATGLMNDYGEGPYPYDNLSYAFIEAEQMNADVTLCVNLGDSENSITQMIQYLEANGYLERIRYFEIGNEVGFVNNLQHATYACSAEDYIARAVTVSQWLRNATSQELTLGFVGSIAADWGGQGCVPGDGGWGAWASYIPMMINYADNNGGKIDFFIFHNYMSYPLVDKHALYTTRHCASFTYLWQNANGDEVGRSQCIWQPAGIYNVTITHSSGYSFTTTIKVPVDYQQTCAPVENYFDFLWSNGSTEQCLQTYDGGTYTVTTSVNNAVISTNTFDFYSDEQVFEYVMANNAQTRTTLTAVQAAIDAAWPPGSLWNGETEYRRIRIGCTEGGTEIYGGERPHLIRRTIEGLYSADNIITAALHKLVNNIHFCLIHHHWSPTEEHGDNVFFDLNETSSNPADFVYPSFQIQEFLAQNIGNYLIPTQKNLPTNTLPNLFTSASTTYELLSHVATQREDGTIALVVLNKDVVPHTLDILLNNNCINTATLKVLEGESFVDEYMELLPPVNLSSLDNVTFPATSLCVLELTLGDSGKNKTASDIQFKESMAKKFWGEDEEGTSTSVLITKAFPNPTSSQITLELSSTKEQNSRAYLYNILGEKIAEKSLSFNTGINTVDWKVKDLPSGVYFISLEMNGERETIRFVKE